MAVETKRVINLHAAEEERAARNKPVDVVSDPGQREEG
jgi:hypothetical protein